MSDLHIQHIRLSGVRDAMSYSPPTGQGPSYPVYQPGQPYQPYAPYQQPYLYQPQPYTPYQQYQPAPELQPDEGPLPEMPEGFAPDRYARIFAVVLSVICLVALVLAAVAPSLLSRAGTTVPTTWGKAYDGTIRADGVWDTADGCNVISSGLDIQADKNSGNLSCDFKPSERLDVSQGFFIQAQVAPAARVAGNQLPMITVGQNEEISVSFDQEGAYRVCVETGTACHIGSTVAWHSDVYVANTIGLLFIPDDATSARGTLTLFVNGQAIGHVSAMVASYLPLALGAKAGGEALFTHVTLYLAGAS